MIVAQRVVYGSVRHASREGATRQIGRFWHCVRVSRRSVGATRRRSTGLAGARSHASGVLYTFLLDVRHCTLNRVCGV
jgi:hypothetical protein